MSTTASAPETPLHQQLAQATQRAESFRRLIASISSELSLDGVLSRIVESAVELLGAEHGGVGLVVQTADGPVIRPNALHNLSPRQGAVDIRPGVGLFGQVLLDHQPRTVERYADIDGLVRPDIADHTLVCVPILWRDELIGVLGIGAPPPHRFGDEDIETLTALARHAAVAIENARLFEAERRRSARMATINRIGRLLTSSLNLDDLLQRAVSVLAEHLAYETIALMLVDPQDPETLVLHSRGGVYVHSNLGAYRQSIHTGIAGAAARARRPLLVNDVRSDPRYISVIAGSNLRAELAIPLVIEDRLLGLLNIESENPITEEDAADFETVGDQLAVAIDNARRYAESQTALAETRLLYDTSRRIGAATTIDGVIMAYLEQVASRGRYACAVALYEDGERGDRTKVVVRGRWLPVVGLSLVAEPLPRTRDGLDPALDMGQTVTIRDVRTDERVPPDLRRRQIESGRPSLAMIPLLVRGERIGLVVLSSPVVRDWSEGDLHPYEVTAAQLATAIDSRRHQQLLLERGRQLAVLEERARLARELHDSVTQLVFSSTLLAQTLSSVWKRDPQEGERRVERVLHTSQLALAELRALLAELRPPSGREAPALHGTLAPGSARVRRDGLAAAIRQHLAVIAQDDLTLRVDAATYVPQDDIHEEALYRIAQEAIANIVKHAHARHVDVRLCTDDVSTRLSVVDDGCGFNSSATTTEGGGFGLGLRSMRERADALGGHVYLTSAPGHGTTVEVVLPRKDGRA
jgi:signal transduction histidine kinase/putative methionine-R-sulfoxide reductase with GAF domain